MSEWVNVKEKLPENDTRVLVYLVDGDYEVFNYCDDGYWHKGVYGSQCYATLVTHWKNLSPPKKF